MIIRPLTKITYKTQYKKHLSTYAQLTNQIFQKSTSLYWLPQSLLLMRKPVENKKGDFMEPVRTIPSFQFDSEKLTALATQHASAYQSGTPYPHITMDDFLPDWVIDRILEEFPDAHKIDWKKFSSPEEKKLGTHNEAQIGPFIRYILYAFNSSTFITFLESLTGIQGLIPDPHFVGGGMHQTLKDGYLKIHADFNIHPRLKLDRRINVLLYLNKDWKEEYGGHFELWDKDMKNCEKQVLPIGNRFVAFSTTSTSFHGAPNPLNCPEDRSRKSLALYYYTSGQPKSELNQSHSTLFQKRPDENWKKTPKMIIRDLLPTSFLTFLKSLTKKK